MQKDLTSEMIEFENRYSLKLGDVIWEENNSCFSDEHWRKWKVFRETIGDYCEIFFNYCIVPTTRSIARSSAVVQDSVKRCRFSIAIPKCPNPLYFCTKFLPSIDPLQIIVIKNIGTITINVIFLAFVEDSMKDNGFRDLISGCSTALGSWYLVNENRKYMVLKDDGREKIRLQSNNQENENSSKKVEDVFFKNLTLFRFFLAPVMILTSIFQIITGILKLSK